MALTDFAYVDIETTGGNALRDRITEIAWIHVRDGEIIDQYVQLINPGVNIPIQIQQFTGISNEMVQGCPSFEDIAAELWDRLDGKIFVAHNARFDYGFIKNAFRRCDIGFSAPVLCTVKLSRRLYAQYRRHNLDSLIERHQLHCEHRHRALGDAQVLHQFVEQARREHGFAVVDKQIAELIKTPSLPPGIDARTLDDVAMEPGVYIFYGVKDIPLYVGKSVNLRTRVLSHFNSDHRSAKDMLINQQLARLETIATAGELGALLKESQLVKELSPVHNRKLRRCKPLYTIEYDSGNLDSTNQPEISEIDRALLERSEHCFGLFKTKKQATTKLKSLAEEHGLCWKVLGLEKSKGACFNYQLQKCSGVCAGQESLLQHQLRLLQAFTSIRLERWPFEGPIGIRETSADRRLQQIHVIDHWFYLGSIDSEDELSTSDSLQAEADFDLDIYRILTRFLLKHSGRLDIIAPLPML